MAIDPPPVWPVEPTAFYIVSYYINNAPDTTPTTILSNMIDYNSALAAAKQTILDNANVGVCTIQQVTAVVVYPSIPWVAF